MGRAIAITRTDISARELRFIAKRTRDCRVVRRILAIALVLEGVDRATSARSSGMDRQTLRDWVHRYNCGGIAELSDRRGKGAKPRLSPTQQAQFVAWVEAGKVFLKACCAAGSVLGCSGRTERRRNPCLARYLPIVRSCSFTPNASSTRACKSAQRHRTTPSLIGLAQPQPKPQNAPVVLVTGVASRPCQVGQKA